MLIPSIISSLIEVVITHPIDVYKTNLQLNKPTHLNHIYKGFIQRALGNIPSRSTFLFTSDYLKQKNINILLIPFISGAIQTVVDTPVENLKIRAINNHKELCPSPFDQKRVRTFKNGFTVFEWRCSQLNLFRGYIPHSARNIIFIGSVITMKERYESIYSGAIGGVIGSYMSHPLDTIKTRIQSYQPYKFVLQDFFTKQLFIGAHPRAIMAFINMMISLNCYDYLKNKIN